MFWVPQDRQPLKQLHNYQALQLSVKTDGRPYLFNVRCNNMTEHLFQAYVVVQTRVCIMSGLSRLYWCWHTQSYCRTQEQMVHDCGESQSKAWFRCLLTGVLALRFRLRSLR